MTDRLEQSGLSSSRQGWAASRAVKVLLALFLVTLPLVNPWVRGDGVGYYAYIQALLIHHDLNFEQAWLAGNPSFVLHRETNGQINAQQYTRTGHLTNNFTVGPAMLWAPFLIPVHLAVTALDRAGAHIPADGFSRPYLVTMAVATAFYGFLGLLLSFFLARKYFPERWACWATVGIWFASSLPVYMYFNPSWSHAHSAFVVALFLWYWQHTRAARTIAQWTVLGLLSGLMADVYYPNAVLLVIPLLESLRAYVLALRQRPPAWLSVARLLLANIVFLAVTLAAFLPTLITRRIIYGSPAEFGQPNPLIWHWASPVFGDVLFSANHGLLSWTPILIPAILGLFLLWKHDRELCVYLLAAFLGFLYLISSYLNWDGISSYGNRFFVSLTPIFVLGLAAFLDAFEKLWRRQRVARALAGTVIVLLIVWNCGFILQWGMHLIPVRGAISWRQMVYNQVAVVPNQVVLTTRRYLFARRNLMGGIEQKDIQQLNQQQRSAPGAPSDQK